MTHPGGRPTDYTEEIADHICEQIANGRSLRKICQDDGLPHRVTIMRWLGIHEGFATKYARAREIQGDWCDDEIAEVIESTKVGDLKPDVARVVLEGQRWRAAKLRPKVYGDLVKQEITGKDGGAVEIRLTKADEGL